jgi:ketosteroid isomerase-like protein
MTSDAKAMLELAKRVALLAETTQLTELAELYSSDATIWINTQGATRSIRDHLATIGQQRANIRNPRWTKIRINTFPGGYVQQWCVQSEGSEGNGREMEFCMICHVRDSKIYHREDYYDSAQLAAMRT